jgi:FtsZ-binding cell division protein ZapB
MINKSHIATAITKLDTSNGIKLSDIVSMARERPCQNANRECSKIMISLGWTKGNTKLFDKHGSRYYLWYAPSGKSAEQMEIEQLKAENSRLENDLGLAERKIIELRQEVKELNDAANRQLDKIRADIEAKDDRNEFERSERLKNRGDISTLFKPVYKTPVQTRELDDKIDIEALRAALAD